MGGQVVVQPTPGIPVYTVKSLSGGQTKILHRNLLLPLQGRLRQKGETVEEGVTDSEEEEEQVVTPCVTRAPKGGPTNTSKPQDDLTPVEPEAFHDLSFHSLDGNSNGENAYDSLTSHTTVSSSTSADFQSTEANSPIPDSITESQFSTVMPYHEDSDQTSTEVFTEISDTETHTNQQIAKSLDTSNISETSKVNDTPPSSPIPRRSTRSTRGAPPVCFGRVITHCTRISDMFDSPVYRQTLFVSSVPTVYLA